MRIEIIGAGAVGLLVASYFAEKNMDVYIVGKPTGKRYAWTYRLKGRM